MSLSGTVSSDKEIVGGVGLLNTINGKSAYEIALMNGFEGTEQEWLDSLKGKDGDDYILTEADRDEIADKVVADDLEEAIERNLEVTASASGNTITIDSANAPLQSLKLYGKTTQNGTPTPDAPVPLVSVGDSGSFEVGVYGKNLYQNKATTQTVQGITYTVNSDGSVTANGTATATSQFNLGTTRLPKGNYKATGYDGSVSNVYLYIRASTDTGWPLVVGERNLTYTQDVNVYFLISIGAGTTVNNLTFYPMIRLATETDSTYEPCNKQTLTMPYKLRSDKAGKYKDTVDFNKGVFVRRIQPIPFDENSINSLQRVEQPAGSGIYRFQAHPNADNPAVKMRFLESGETLSTFLPYGTTPLGNNSKNNVITTNANGGLYFRCDSITGAGEFLQMARANNWEAQGILETPVEIPLTETELNAYRQLLTNKGTTNILCEADMDITYYSPNEIGQSIGTLHSIINQDYIKSQKG